MNLSDETKKKYGDPYDYTHPMNPKTGTREQTRSLLGFGGYLSNAIDVALRHDDPDGFVELMRASNLDATSRTFDGLTMEAYCEKREAPKCRKALKMLSDQAAIREMSAQRRGAA